MSHEEGKTPRNPQPTSRQEGKKRFTSYILYSALCGCCFWALLCLIKKEAKQSAPTNTPSPGRHTGFLTGCRHLASPNLQCLPSPSWPLTWAMACVWVPGGSLSSNTQWLRSSVCIFECVCVGRRADSFSLSHAGFQCPSAFSPPILALTWWSTLALTDLACRAELEG